MSSYDLFEDDLLEDSDVKPFHEIQKQSEKKVLDWLNQVKDSLMKQAQSRTSRQRENLLHYRGTQLRKSERDRDYNGRRLNKVQRFVVNHLFDLTETKVSQMNRLKPAVEVLPTNDEWADRASAKVTGFLIKHLWYTNNVDYLITNMHRHARIFGESYCFPVWDKDIGNLDPMYVEARDAGIEKVILPDGKKISLEQPIKIGDIKYEIEAPWRVLLQRKYYIDDVEYCFRIKVESIYDLKKDYPSKASKIESDDSMAIFDMEELERKFVEEHVPVFEFYHKHTKYVGKGSYIKFTPDVILEKGDHPFTHGGMPFIRLTDLDVPEVLNGVSRYEMILPMQNMYNNMSTLIAKNIYLMAHAKWMVPRGACKIESLGNDNTVVQFQGPVAPQMAQTQPNPPEAYAFRQNIKEEMQTIYGSHGISRGEIPKGITAASALQFLNELENERASTDVAKHGFLVKDLAKMTIAIVADKYDISDGRMIRIVGENNKYLIRHFDSANLNKDYDVRFDNSTGLPETKAAKMQRIFDTMQRNPNLFSPERWEELLELGNTEKMFTLATEALRSADSETEDLMAGRQVALPEEFEDHIAHWRSHARAFQSRAFKEEADEGVKESMKQHMFITEKAIIEKMGGNMLFQSKVAELKLFPLFYHGNTQAPLSAEHQKAMVEGQANRGDEVSGSIPAQDIEEKRLLKEQE